MSDDRGSHAAEEAELRAWFGEHGPARFAREMRFDKERFYTSTLKRKPSRPRRRNSWPWAAAAALLVLLLAGGAYVLNRPSSASPAAAGSTARSSQPTTPSKPPVSSKPLPSLFVKTIIVPGTLYASGHYPTSFWYANTDELKNITWDSVTAAGAVGHGTYTWDNCNPNCATGTIETAAATISATQPTTCTVTLVDRATGAQTPERKLVFDMISVTFPPGAARPPYPVTFAPSCASSASSSSG